LQLVQLISKFLMFSIDETNIAVRAEQINSRLRLYPRLVLTQWLLAFLLVTIMWGGASHERSIAWLLLVSSIHLYSLVLWSLNRGPVNDIAQARRWSRHFSTHAVLAGLAWGSSAILMFVPGQMVYQMYLFSVLLGVSAGAIASNPVHPPSLFIHLTGLMLPLTVHVLLQGDWPHLILGVMLVMYIVFVLNAAMDIISIFEQSLQRRIENETLANELKQAQAIAHIGSWRYVMATDELIWTEEMYRVYGVSSVDFTPSVPALIALAHTDDQAALQNWMLSFSAGQKVLAGTFRFVRPDGSYCLIEHHGELVMDARGEPGHIAGTAQDVTERRRIDEELRVAATVFESHEGMLVTDAKSRILRVNKAFTTITGYTSEEAIGNTPRMLHSGRHDIHFYKAMWSCINRTGKWDGEIWNRRKNGEIYPEHLTITAVKAPNGTVTNYVATLTDITLSRAAEDEIRHLAFYDALTRLPNRRLLLDRLQVALSAITRDRHGRALLFIDLDNFKTLNDTLGHDIGDLLLQQVAERLESCVRIGDSVARLGGDEFVVMLEDLSVEPIEAAAQAEAIGNKILATLNRPYQLAAHEHLNSSSIGITLIRDCTQSVDELMKQADIAMYQAKKGGRNTLRFFDPRMQESINTRARLESELQRALEQDQFRLHYQVQVDSELKPFGAEALLRRIHPVNGIVSPMTFIPLAEETGVIIPVGLWVLETVCAQLKAWEKNPLTRDLVLAVNVSAKQFRLHNFVSQVRDAVQRHGINPQNLKLELTETLLLDDIEAAASTMNALNALGIRFSLDDFGTGYSSLQYLKRLPLDQIKIDKSFVRDITADPSDRTIVRTIIAIAGSFNLNVIAEGVETTEQLTRLANKGCNHYQGYLFGRPVPIEEFELQLSKFRRAVHL